jgi:DNA-binding transcriptional LysR family regulator
MDPHSLKVFIAVAKAHSFTDAADVLYLTQPAVSKRIAALEHQLNTRLFDRVGHNIQLTSAGKRLLEHAQRILADIEQAKQELKNISGEAAGPLQIATGHHIGLHRLPPIWKRITQNYPAIDLEIHFMDSEEAYAGVCQGHIECAVLTMPTQLHPELVGYPIWRDPMAVYCSCEHPLARLPDVTAADLAQFPVILPEKQTFTRQAITDYFYAKGISLPLVKTGDYLETIKTLVECGLGWSVLPLTLQSNRLHPLLRADFKLSRTLGLIHHKKRPLSNAGQAFLTLLVESSDND